MALKLRKSGEKVSDVLFPLYLYVRNIIQIYSGITCGRVLNSELYTCKLYKLINLCWSHVVECSMVSFIHVNCIS